jgi:hypothetical protein
MGGSQSNRMAGIYRESLIFTGESGEVHQIFDPWPVVVKQ